MNIGETKARNLTSEELIDELYSNWPDEYVVILKILMEKLSMEPDAADHAIASIEDSIASLNDAIEALK